MNATSAEARMLRQQPCLGGRQCLESVDRQLGPKCPAPTMEPPTLIGRWRIRLQRQLRVASPVEKNRARLGNALGRTDDALLRDARLDAPIVIAGILRLAPLGRP